MRENEFFTVSQLIAKYPIPRRTVQQWLADGDVPSILVGKTYVVDESVFVQFIKEKKPRYRKFLAELNS
jgi:hypothetical protein